ncbi:MAG TPA: aldehyde ferredoxin oxidoreductase family protein [Desulfobacteraceae bacterium]|nr:aldehyde ferredoxin oxidoreductase family protein [Desulfobacteraceae bacterium]
MPLNRRIAYIDLTRGEITTETISEKMRRLYLGGRGLDMYLLYNHVPEGADPLGPDNAAIVSAGLLVGTLASASSRTHVAAKSPLTGYVGSANIGGFFGPEMRLAGFDHLVIKGKAPSPVYLYVNNGIIDIRDASELWGQDTHTTQTMIQEAFSDPDIKSLCIGEAGENQVRYACVMTSLKNAAGRTGIGAVWGSKNLKAISARGSMDIELAHPMEALEYNKEIIDQVVSAKVSKTMQKLGTPFIWGVTNSTGLVRTRNFQSNQLTHADDIEPESIEEDLVGTAGCFGCQVHCRGKYIIKEGEYKGTYDEGPEYTSIGAFGAEVGCRSKNTVLVGNHLVNHYGMDNLETGSMISWAMELYEKGILTKKETNGVDLTWGNDEAVIQMIHMIARREGLGDILAKGPLRAAAAIGGDSLKYQIHVKGMSNLHSDERPTPALALNVAVSSRGSDHLRGRPAIDLYHLPEAFLRKRYSNPVAYDGPLTSDFRDYEGKPWQVIWQEICYEAVDCLGICKYHTVFLGPNMPAFDEWARLIYLNTGLSFTAREIWDVGDRAYTMERLFNIREGLDRSQDDLVDRYFDEPVPMGLPVIRGRCIDREKFAGMLDEYYQRHGWDDKGVPTRETLERLSLDQEPSNLL